MMNLKKHDPSCVIINDLKYLIKDRNIKQNNNYDYFTNSDFDLNLEIFGIVPVQENDIGKIHIPLGDYINCYSGIFINVKQNIEQDYPSNLYNPTICTLIGFCGNLDECILLEEYYLTEDELIIKNIIE